MKSNKNVKTKNVKKTSCKLSKTKKKRVRVLELLGNFLSVPKIAKIIGCKEGGIYRLIARMVKEGLITNTKEKIVTEKGVAFVKSSYEVSQNVKNQKETRLHKIQFEIGILCDKKFWNKVRRERVLKLKLDRFEDWENNNAFFQQFYVEDAYIRSNNVGVSIVFEEIRAKSPLEAKIEAIKRLYEVIPKVEKIFGVRLAKNGRCNIFISDQHNALVLNEFATFFYNSGFDLKIYDLKGNLRAVTDLSKGFPELEFVNSKYSEDDATEVKDLIEDVILRKHLLLSELTDQNKQIWNTMREISELQHDSAIIVDNFLFVFEQMFNFNKSLIKNNTKQKNQSPTYLG